MMGGPWYDLLLYRDSWLARLLLDLGPKWQLLLYIFLLLSLPLSLLLLHLLCLELLILLLLESLKLPEGLATLNLFVEGTHPVDPMEVELPQRHVLVAVLALTGLAPAEGLVLWQLVTGEIHLTEVARLRTRRARVQMVFHQRFLAGKVATVLAVNL
jgi:hypothetical protein